MWVFVWPCVPARLCISPAIGNSPWHSTLGSRMCVSRLFRVFSFYPFGFWFPSTSACVLVCWARVWLSRFIQLRFNILTSHRHGAHHCRVADVVAVFVPIVLSGLVALYTHTYKQFDYNNKCKFTRCFLYKYDCFINVCHQLESNHRRVKTIRSLLGATKQNIWLSFVHTLRTTWIQWNWICRVFFSLKSRSMFDLVQYFGCSFFLGCVISTSAASTFE